MMRSLIIVAGFACVWSAQSQSTPLADTYGFVDPEIYKLDFRISNLLARDINGDGKLDLICTNNIRSRIDVLAQRDSEAPPAKDEAGVNEIRHDQRMEHRKIQVRRTIGSLEVRDVNSDGRADLVYLGDPKGLYIEYGQPDGTFGQERVFENSDAQIATWTLDVADFTGDGKEDIAYLGQKYLYLIKQEENGRLSNPTRFRLGDDQPGLLRIIDLDADGRSDLIYFAQAADLPIRIRYQQDDGSFGPERRLRVDPPRGVSFADFDGKPGQEVLTISSLSDRFMVYGFEETEPTDDRPTGEAIVFPLDSAGSGKIPDVAVADFDGDGAIDVVASDAESSQFQFFGAARKSTSFPSMLGTEAIRAADPNGDGRSCLVALSTKDKSLAVSEFQDGRLTFPQAIAGTNDALAFDLVGAGPDTRLLYIAKVEQPKEGGGKTEKHVLRKLKPGANDLEWTPDPFAVGPEIEIKVDSKLSDLRSADVNADGILDLVLCQSFRPPLFLLGQKDGGFVQSADAGKGTLGNLTAADLYYGPILEGENAFLVTQEGFARRLKLEESGRWAVLDQFNAGSGSAKIRGVAALDLVGDKTLELAMYDRASQSLIFLRAENGLYRAWQTLKVGSFDLRGMRIADFNSDGTPDLLLYDGEKMAIVPTRTKDTTLRVLASYESSNKETQLFDMVPGDLNGDGKLDVLLLDPMDHNLEVVTSPEPGKIERVLRWQVFEEKTFQRQSGSIEPREAVIADVDGDGLNDISLLVHDRVLIYRQDDGHGEPAAAAK